jgi:hypothetical protein
MWDQVKVKVTLRLTVSQSVSHAVEPQLGLMTRYSLLFISYGLVFVGRPLWREDGSVFCICCWPSPPQSFSIPSPLLLVAVFYSLRFETSFSSPPTTRRATVEVFDPASTWGYIGSESESESLYDWQSVSLSVLVSSPVWGSWPDI